MVCIYIKEYLFVVSAELMKCKLDKTPFDLGKICHIKAETEPFPGNKNTNETFWKIFISTFWNL